MASTLPTELFLQLCQDILFGLFNFAFVLRQGLSLLAVLELDIVDQAGPELAELCWD